MSKLLLKKELKALSRDQLEQMILDAYDAKKEIKEYFEFYVNPDVKKLSEKFKVAISREFARNKHGYSKARISIIRKLIKEFQAFQPGFEAELDLLHYTVTFALLAEMSFKFSDILILGISMLLDQTVELADRNLVADETLTKFTNLFNNETAGTKNFRRFLRNSINNIQASSPFATKE